MRRDDNLMAIRLQEVLVRLRAEPWKIGFLALMRRFGAAYSDGPRIGLAGRPRQEPFRLGQAAALTFAPREIAEVVLPLEAASSIEGQAPARKGNNPAIPAVRLYGLGLLGPNGPLPLHYTELVRERTENHNDHTLADFLDIFHHRYLTHMYRAWAQGQSTAGLDRPDDEIFSRYIARLTGHDPLEIRDSVLPSHARLSASSHLSREARNPDGLAATLARFFGVPVDLQEFAMHWIRVDKEDQTHLGSPRASCVLGTGAIAGELVADRQNKFRLVLGPLSLKQYLRFTPQGEDVHLLVEWVRAFTGYEFVWEVELRVHLDSTPPARLEANERLGWSTWLGRSEGESRLGEGASRSPASTCDYTIGLVFEPEAYMSTRKHVDAFPVH